MTLLIKNNPLAIKKLSCVFFIIGIIMSNKLWLIDRNFPTAPLFDNFINIPRSFDSILYYSLLILLAIVALLKRRVYLLLLFILLFFLLIQDQMRWQPWVYIYILVLIPFLVLPKGTNKNRTTYLQILFIGIYLWSGIHKLNPNFNELIVESFAFYLFKITNGTLITFIKSIGFIFPLIEIISAMFLVFPKSRKVGVYMTVSIHVFIILYISPFGMNYNYIILPWNIFMIIASILLFYTSKQQLKIWDNKPMPNFLNSFILIIMLLPVMNFFNRWDSYLSFSLYSGKIDNYYVLLKKGVAQQENTYDFEAYLINKNQSLSKKIIDIDRWSIKELNVPMYPEKRVFRKIAQHFCTQKTMSSNTVFLVTKLPLWKLRELDKHKKATDNNKDYIDQLLVLDFEKSIKNDSFEYYKCEDLLSLNP